MKTFLQQGPFTQDMTDELLLGLQKDAFKFKNANDYNLRMPVLIYPFSNPANKEKLYRIYFGEGTERPYATMTGTTPQLTDIIREVKEGFKSEEHLVVKEWLEQSHYKYFFEHILLSTKNPKIISSDFKPSTRNEYELKKRRDRLLSFMNNITNEEILRKELEYQFDEHGRRLEDLFQEAYSFLIFDSKKIGDFEVTYLANAKEFVDTLESTGNFFEDLDNFYNAILDWEPTIYYSGRTKLLFAKEAVDIQGYTNMLEDSSIKIVGGVAFYGMSNVFGSYLKMQAKSFDEHDFYNFFSTLRGYESGIEQDSAFALSPDQRLIVTKNSEDLILRADPEYLSKQGLDILQAVSEWL